ncbi:hypothetical protein A3A21_03995 [Candidatus Jorgensenbacteria bacterium RIFCSPLOWO2_01_FULL_45_25b]|uniref:Uncharacterized protein n=1 Tax=Candidatus Jorgensenbacteria bacterium RIFCSPLOWO2_01_FULL_45_25b TaxID=1798471 RepID=A0A1F6BWI4_9BACT|nr:MAG: hypothetical protein A3A21_03995 [Candidatus Jorgensenbacteria bacterium RIFCSPLOWO2_01_FULL_45_25b]
MSIIKYIAESNHFLIVFCLENMSFDELYHKKIGKLLPKHARPEKIIEEVSEHLSSYKQMIFYVLGPLLFFYFGMGIFVGEYSGGAALFALFISFYSSFLPEADLMLTPKGFLARRGRVAKPYEKYFILFFAPFYLYLIATKKMRPVFSNEYKPFHRLRAFFLYAFFLFVLGLILYASLFKAFFFMLFGAIGYATHLVVDKVI